MRVSVCLHFGQVTSWSGLGSVILIRVSQSSVQQRIAHVCVVCIRAALRACAWIVLRVRRRSGVGSVRVSQMVRKSQQPWRSEPMGSLGLCRCADACP